MEPRRERFGKYHVLERIAQGGMAEVYKVKTVGIAGFEKIQALKRILPAAAREGRFIRSFVDEARIAVELNHRNIVQVFDFGKADGELYLAMELIEGKDLRTAVELAQARAVPLPVPTACYVIAEVGAGLDYAHRKTDGTGRPLGIVHCDVSPANVMLSDDGYVKILDFGVARASFASAVEQRRLRGKPRYMAPEQTRGEAPTSATDVFALGIVAWEVLTGLPLFDGADLKAILAAVRRADAPRVDRLNPEVPAELARAVATALTADPAARGTAAELTAAAIRAGHGAGSRALAEWLGAIDAAAPATTAVTDLVASGFTSDTMSRGGIADATPIPTAVSPTRPVRRGDRHRAAAVPIAIDEPPAARRPRDARAILAAAEPEPTRFDPRAGLADDGAPERGGESLTTSEATHGEAPPGETTHGEATRAEPGPRDAPAGAGATQVMLGHSVDLGERTDDWEEAPRSTTIRPSTIARPRAIRRARARARPPRPRRSTTTSARRSRARWRRGGARSWSRSRSSRATPRTRRGWPARSAISRTRAARSCSRPRRAARWSRSASRSPARTTSHRRWPTRSTRPPLPTTSARAARCCGSAGARAWPPPPTRPAARGSPATRSTRPARWPRTRSPGGRCSPAAPAGCRRRTSRSASCRPAATCTGAGACSSCWGRAASTSAAARCSIGAAGSSAGARRSPSWPARSSRRSPRSAA